MVIRSTSSLSTLLEGSQQQSRGTVCRCSDGFHVAGAHSSDDLEQELRRSGKSARRSGQPAELGPDRARGRWSLVVGSWAIVGLVDRRRFGRQRSSQPPEMERAPGSDTFGRAHWERAPNEPVQETVKGQRWIRVKDLDNLFTHRPHRSVTFARIPV